MNVRGLSPSLPPSLPLPSPPPIILSIIIFDLDRSQATYHETAECMLETLSIKLHRSINMF